MRCLFCLTVLLAGSLAIADEHVTKLTTEVPGNLFFTTESTTGRISINPSDWQDGEVAVILSIFDANSNQVDRSEHAIPAGQDHIDVQLPSGPGYYRVEAGLMSKGAEEPAVRFSNYYAVVPPNPYLNEKDPASPFGVNTHMGFSDFPYPPEVGAMVKRAGIAWVRDVGRDVDRIAETVKTHNLCWFWIMSGEYRDTEYFMEKLIAGKESRQWDFTQEIEEQRSQVRKYAALADAYDLMNEPAGPWTQALGGDFSGGEWIHALGEYGKQVTQMIREEDPGAPMLWETQGPFLCYDEFLELNLKPWIDGVSPHVYPDAERWEIPENHDILKRYDDFHTTVAKQGLDLPIWIGETGSSTWEPSEEQKEKKDGLWWANTEPEQADELVRIMMLHWMSGADKIFWYDMVDDGLDASVGVHRFGLMRYTHEPKPAVVAYANLIHQMREARRLGRCDLGNDTYAYAVIRAGEPVVVAWVKDGVKPRTVSLPGEHESVTLMDIYGRTSQTSGDVTLTTSPVYLIGLSSQSVASILKTKTWTSFERE